MSKQDIPNDEDDNFGRGWKIMITVRSPNGMNSVVFNPGTYETYGSATFAQSFMPVAYTSTHVIPAADE